MNLYDSCTERYPGALPTGAAVELSTRCRQLLGELGRF